MKSLFERYLDGETKEVYEAIDLLHFNQISEQQQNEIHQILNETFRRVKHNLHLIYQELQTIGYIFSTDEPLLNSFDDTEDTLSIIGQKINVFGKVPLSLQYFYKHAGAVDFCWDYDDETPILWELSDPIQIINLKDLLKIINSNDWQTEMHEIYEDEQIAYLELSADVYHKDNISGGRSYSIKINNETKIDSKFLFEAHNTSFINYLRVCFEYGGFPGVAKFGSNSSFKEYLSKIKPQLVKI